MSPLASQPSLSVDLFDYELPEHLIAQQPAEPRDSARLLLLDRRTGRRSHHTFRDLPELLEPGDLLVVNRTRVVPARLTGRRVPSGGQVEALLLAELEPGTWHALVRPGRRLPPGSRVRLERGGRSLTVEVGDRLPTGGRLLRTLDPDAGRPDVLGLGAPPLPPYIRSWSGDPERYQTVYGDRPGSAAAPTAGLHFTAALLDRLGDRGVGLVSITLHVGVDTFRPIRGPAVEQHEMHTEQVEVGADVLAAIRDTRRRGGRVVAVGTTTVRALESAAAYGDGGGWSGATGLYITPGHDFRNVDAMITNFHFPRSTLLVLVSAFAGRERVLSAYAEAVRAGYRFYSFGDAMLLL